MNRLSLKKTLFFIFFWGCALSATQTVLLREYLCAGGGNEITVGLMLSVWLLFNSIGAFISGLKRGIFTGRLNLFPLLGIFITSSSLLVIRYSRIIFDIETGTLLSWQTMAILAVISISLPALISGLSFPYLSGMLGFFKRDTGTAYVYGTESLGLVSGYLLAILLIKTGFNHLGVITLVYGFCLLFLLTANLIKDSLLKITLALILLFAAVLGMTHIDNLTIRHSFTLSNPGFGFIKHRETNYNRYILAERNNQKILFTNNHYSGLVGDEYNSKIIAHLIMSLSDKNNKVLVIGELSYDLVRHISEHKAKTDYIEYDGGIMMLLKNYALFNDYIHRHRNLSIIYDDGRRYIKNSGEVYDLIILDLPDPLSLQMNRYFTLDFFSEVRKVLNKDGILVVPLPPISSTPSPTKRDYGISVFMSLKKVFFSVKVIEYGRTYLLASDAPLDLNFENIVKRFKSTEIPDCDFEPEVLSLALQEENNNRIQEIFEKGIAPLNLDLEPRGMLKGLILWEMSVSSGGGSLLNKISGSILLIFLGIVLLIFVVAFVMRRVRSVAVANLMFWQGFISMSLELVIIYRFQIQSGTLYYYMALLFSSFMAGLSLGSFLTKYSKVKYSVLPPGNIIIIIILFLFSVSNPFLFLLLFLNGLLTGLLFGELSLIMVSYEDVSVEKAASLNDYSDCLGGMLSSIIIPLMVIPVLGLKDTLIILGFIGILQLIYSFMTNLSE